MINRQVSDPEFSEYVSQAVDMLPPEYSEKLHNVEFIVMDLADRETCRMMDIPSPLGLYGLYEGVPQPERRNYQMVLPDRITIYKIPHLLASHDVDDLRSRIRATILHEIGHHFGLSEDELSEQG